MPITMTLRALIVVALCFSNALAEKVSPCKEVTDKCVGEFMSSHSAVPCSLPTSADLKALSSYHVVSTIASNPYFNLTYVRTNMDVDGVDACKATGFFYNTENNRAVLTISCPKFSTRGQCAYHLRNTGDEPISVSSPFKYHFSDVIFTTIFGDYKRLNLTESMSFSEVRAQPVYDHGPQFAEAAKNIPEFKRLHEEQLKYPTVMLMESMQYRTPAMVKMIVQNKMCKNKM